MLLFIEAFLKFECIFCLISINIIFFFKEKKENIVVGFWDINLTLGECIRQTLWN